LTNKYVFPQNPTFETCLVYHMHPGYKKPGEISAPEYYEMYVKFN